MSLSIGTNNSESLNGSTPPVLEAGVVIDPSKNTGLSQASVGSKLHSSINSTDATRVGTGAHDRANDLQDTIANVADVARPGTMANENVTAGRDMSARAVDPENAKLDSSVVRTLFSNSGPGSINDFGLSG
ncbi:MAG: hypothetical protein LBT64_03020 [Puniceicoccales bacterium]|nr:hypothetical protein [Puniceicoccales bacterium]